MRFLWLDSMFIVIAIIVVVLILLAAFEAGFRLAGRADRKKKAELTGVMGSMVGGGLGLLAFVLAFTFSIASNHYDTRKKNVIEEANAIGTAYLRADLLDDTPRSELKQLLKDYVDNRVDAIQDVKILSEKNLADVLRQSASIQQRLWATVAAAARTSPSPNTSLVIQAINDVIDVHSKRVAASLQTRIPDSVWGGLFTIALMAIMTLGVQVGFTGKRNLTAVTPLILAFSLLVILALDLDRPQRGLLIVGQQAMVDLQTSMGVDSATK